MYIILTKSTFNTLTIVTTIFVSLVIAAIVASAQTTYEPSQQQKLTTISQFRTQSSSLPKISTSLSSSSSALPSTTTPTTTTTSAKLYQTKTGSNKQRATSASASASAPAPVSAANANEANNANKKTASTEPTLTSRFGSTSGSDNNHQTDDASIMSTAVMSSTFGLPTTTATPSFLTPDEQQQRQQQSNGPSLESIKHQRQIIASIAETMLNQHHAALQSASQAHLPSLSSVETTTTTTTTSFVPTTSPSPSPTTTTTTTISSQLINNNKQQHQQILNEATNNLTSPNQVKPPTKARRAPFVGVPFVSPANKGIRLKPQVPPPMSSSLANVHNQLALANQNNQIQVALNNRQTHLPAAHIMFVDEMSPSALQMHQQHQQHQQVNTEQLIRMMNKQEFSTTANEQSGSLGETGANLQLKQTTSKIPELANVHEQQHFVDMQTANKQNVISTTAKPTDLQTPNSNKNIATLSSTLSPGQRMESLEKVEQSLTNVINQFQNTVTHVPRTSLSLKTPNTNSLTQKNIKQVQKTNKQKQPKQVAKHQQLKPSFMDQHQQQFGWWPQVIKNSTTNATNHHQANRQPQDTNSAVKQNNNKPKAHHKINKSTNNKLTTTNSSLSAKSSTTKRKPTTKSLQHQNNKQTNTIKVKPQQSITNLIQTTTSIPSTSTSASGTEKSNQVNKLQTTTESSPVDVSSPRPTVQMFDSADGKQQQTNKLDSISGHDAKSMSLFGETDMSGINEGANNNNKLDDDDNKFIDYNNNNNNQLIDTVAGEPNVDYPILAQIPVTSFDCLRQSCVGGYYADIDTRCQVFHVCQPDGRHDSFLCPNGTIFSQQHFVCTWWWQVDCPSSQAYYKLNDNVYCSTSASNSLAPNTPPTMSSFMLTANNNNNNNNNIDNTDNAPMFPLPNSFNAMLPMLSISENSSLKSKPTDDISNNEAPVALGAAQTNALMLINHHHQPAVDSSATLGEELISHTNSAAEDQQQQQQQQVQSHLDIVKKARRA